MAGATPPRPARRSGNALPDGARLGEFELRSVIGEGGFGIVYLAWDHLLQRQVAIKEYMPSTLATRSLTTDVTPRADKFAETFALGLRSFINEAQLLASFDHPALLKVYRFWESNGTAYMVMPFYQGTTLKRTLIALNAPPDEGWLMAQLVPLLDALELMHQAHCYHRDIAPDNILLLDEGRPLLLDFGAARRVIGDATQALTAFLKPGYAPVEQYAEMPSMKQGAWTDLYALGSVLHYAIVGHTPPESVARLVNDAMVPLTRAAAGRYSERFLRAVDHALGVRPQDRPQSVAEMRLDLGIAARRTPTRRPGDIPTAPQALDPLNAPQPFDVPPVSSVDDDDATRAPEPATIVALQATPRAQPPAAVAPRVRSGVWIGTAFAASLGFGLWWLWMADARAPPAAPQRAAPAVVAPPPAVLAPPAQDAARRVEGTVTEAVRAAPADAPAPEPSAPPAAAEPPDDQPRAPTKARPAPRLNSPDARCAEIIARVSLGEELSAAERATLQGECRR
jgi:serine/threonine protein kinase